MNECIPLILQRLNALENRRFIEAGIIKKVDGNKVEVVIGDNETPLIPYLSTACGQVKIHHLPSVGEACIVLNYGDPKNLQSCVALCGLNSEQFTHSTADANKLTINAKNIELICDSMTLKGDIKIQGVADVGSISDIEKTFSDHTHQYSGTTSNGGTFQGLTEKTK